jgi:hypothetical protein
VRSDRRLDRRPTEDRARVGAPGDARDRRSAAGAGPRRGRGRSGPLFPRGSKSLLRRHGARGREGRRRGVVVRLARGRFVVGSSSGSASHPSLAAAAPVGTGMGRWSGALVARLDMKGSAGRMSFAGIPDRTTISMLDRNARLLYRYPPSSADPLGRKAEGPLAAALDGGGGTPGDDAGIGGEGSVIGTSTIDAYEDGVADVYVAASWRWRSSARSSTSRAASRGSTSPTTSNPRGRG